MYVHYCNTLYNDEQESALGIICMLYQQTSPKRLFANTKMTSYCDTTSSVYAVTVTIIGHRSILELIRGHAIKNSPRASPNLCTPLLVNDAQCVVATQLQQVAPITIKVSIYKLTSNVLPQTNVISNVCITISQKDRGLVNFESSQGIPKFLHRKKNPTQRRTSTHTGKLRKSKKYII